MAFDKNAAFDAALKLAEAPPPETPPAAEASPQAEDITEADGHLEPAEAAAETKTEEKAPETKAAPPPLKDFEQIAREKVAERARKEAEKGDAAKQSRAAALLDAAERGDAMALLTAAKIPWNSAAKQVLEGKVE